jgi:glycosyltransferase involved in cell wall biosynthesis
LKDRIQALAARDGGESLVFHLHGTWLASQWYGARIAEKRGIPTVWSVHGQLERYHWTDRGVIHLWKKRLYWRLMAFPAFRSARVIHAVTRQEQETLSTFFKDQPIVVIPNAADLGEIDRALVALGGSVQKEPVIGFLGRFHPKKGVDILIRAFSDARLPQDWRLLLAGPSGRPTYMRELVDLVAASPARDRIAFIGPLSGDAKWRFYRRATVVAVPSHSEVIGMVNLEAAACGTPTITTHETGLDDWEAGGGILIHPEAQQLAQALRLMCFASEDEHKRRSVAARRLVENNYSWAVMKHRWLSLYESIA